MSADRDALRRRIYGAARGPAIRLSESTLALAVDGGVFHLNSTEADEIARAVMDVVGPIIDEHDRVKNALDEIEKRAREAEQAGTTAAYCALWDAHGILDDALNPATEGAEA